MSRGKKRKPTPVANRIVRISPTLDRQLRRLTPDQAEAVRQSLKRFIDRSAEHSLRPEKKSGLGGIWAIRVNSGDRLFYVQETRSDGQTVSVFFHYGPHDDYRVIERLKPQ